jgi:AraC-like DNA-binding protein/quercetin dioxygenase-like cupin family protein
MATVLADITQGTRLARIDGDGFALHEVAYGSGREMAAHAHRTANVSLLLAGEMKEDLDGIDERCAPLSVVLRPAGTVHATRSGARGARSLVLELSPVLEERLRRRSALLDRCRWIHDAGPAAACILRLWRALRAGTCPDGPFIERWFAEFTAAAAPFAPRAARAHVRAAIDLIERQPGAGQTSHLARRLRLHPVYLARLFRERLGCSPTQFRIRRQVRAAVDRLVGTDDPLARIALDAGFADQAHLSRRLKRETGLTPGTIRRLAATSHGGRTG